MSMTHERDFQNDHYCDLEDNMVFIDVEKSFFELFIMCLLLKGYYKAYGIESVIVLHRTSFIPYIVYSNKPEKIYFGHIFCLEKFLLSTLR